jgi:hypothetical protein
MCIKHARSHARSCTATECYHVTHECDAAVEWRECDEPHCSEICSVVNIDVDLVIPKWFFLPKTAVRSTGNAIMNTVLKAAVPKFLSQLEADYTSWADGDASRLHPDDSGSS